MSTTQTGYEIDRKAASKLLKVSIRTVDRYVKLKKVSSKVVGSRIWLNKEELLGFINKNRVHRSVDNNAMSTSNLSSENDVDNVDSVEVLDQDFVHNMSTGSSTRAAKSAGGNVYKKLYEETKQELAEKQERLEIANYRVGQLEAQVKTSIPLLQYNKESYEHTEKEEKLRQELEQKSLILKKLSFQARMERFSKKLFLVILLTILALQPLWLLFLYN